jgi:hypothetical protein
MLKIITCISSADINNKETGVTDTYFIGQLRYNEITGKRRISDQTKMIGIYACPH